MKESVKEKEPVKDVASVKEVKEHLAEAQKEAKAEAKVEAKEEAKERKLAKKLAADFRKLAGDQSAINQLADAQMAEHPGDEQVTYICERFKSVASNKDAVLAVCDEYAK